MNGFIIAAVYDNGSLSYVSNTNPILWSNKVEQSKIFLDKIDAENDLYENFITLSATVSYTNIVSIVILEYRDSIEIRRYKFL